VARNDTPTVLVCDDHAVFAEALASALEADQRFASIGFSCSAGEALDIASRQLPDIVVADLRMPDVEGTELVERFKNLDPAPAVLVLSVANDPRSIIGVFEAGADGFLGKHEALSAVVDAAQATLSGDAPISASAFARLLPRLVPGREPGGLTGREEGVLELLGEGYGNDEIGDRLGISVNTVRNHVSSILEKLDVDNRGQAAAEARRRGILPAE